MFFEEISWSSQFIIISFGKSSADLDFSNIYFHILQIQFKLPRKCRQNTSSKSLTVGVASPSNYTLYKKQLGSSDQSDDIDRNWLSGLLGELTRNFNINFWGNYYLTCLNIFLKLIFR